MYLKTFTSAFACAAILSLPALAQEPDLIAGLRTNDFARLLPKGGDAPNGYSQKAIQTDPSKHLVVADYEADDGASFANVRVVAWPPDNPAEIASDDAEVIVKSTDGIRKMMGDEGFPEPEAFDLTTPAGQKLSCLLTEQKPGVAEFVYCVMPVKGRLMEIQHFASVEARDATARRDTLEDFTGGLVDHVAEAE